MMSRHRRSFFPSKPVGRCEHFIEEVIDLLNCPVDFLCLSRLLLYHCGSPSCASYGINAYSNITTTAPSAAPISRPSTSGILGNVPRFWRVTLGYAAAIVEVAAQCLGELPLHVE